MNAYADKRLLFGDLHNHCGISYGHGSLEDALLNARERLDFVSVTGHAHWPDMPARDGEIDYIIDFHEAGFARLRRAWPAMMKTLCEHDEDGRFVVFPGFEVHFSASGDRNMIYRDLAGDILYPKDLNDLNRLLREQAGPVIAQPHHIGYRKGTRGIDWESFDSEFAPFVEMVSMHGCSESSENTRPFLHSMGGSDHGSSIRCGLRKGLVFGFSGGTDHHSAHPGSYGHGMTGLWSASGSRADIWEGLNQRRMFALTGDRMDLRFTVNGHPMGDLIPVTDSYECAFEIRAGGAIDCVDILRDGDLVRRFSQYEIPVVEEDQEFIHTKIYLELGWGARHRETRWESVLGISDGQILAVEPRFRGREVVSPVEGAEVPTCYHSRVLQREEREVVFTTLTHGNPNNSTNASQGMCLEVRMPKRAEVWAKLNGRKIRHSLEELLEGARTGRLGEIDSPAWRFHRAPLPHHWKWSGTFRDMKSGASSYYLRVRQLNDQWAWSSPVFPRV